jgi:hypothetical protein
LGKAKIFLPPLVIVRKAFGSNCLRFAAAAGVTIGHGFLLLDREERRHVPLYYCAASTHELW